MKFCKKEQTVQHKNSDNCIVTVPVIEDAELSMASAKITGRYPETGYAVNHKINEMVYIQSGEGSICIQGEVQSFVAGDVLLVERGEQFYWDGDFSMIIACNPAFTPEQHERFDENNSDS